MIPEGFLNDRAAKVAEDIHRDFKGQDLEVFVIMNSAFKFFSDLLIHLRNISQITGENVNVVPRFFKITSYHLNQQVVDKDSVRSFNQI